MSVSPRERADKVRDELRHAFAHPAVLDRRADYADALLPPGSLVLTADQAETVRVEIVTLVKNISGGWRNGQPHDPETRRVLALLSPDPDKELR